MNHTPAKENETALIGSILKNPSQFEKLKDELGENDFYDVGLRACWTAFRKIHDEGMTIDQVTVGDELERAGNLQDVVSGQWTGRPAISAIRDAGTHVGADSYAENVLDYSAKRQLLDKFSQGAYWSNNGRRSVEIQADMLELLSSIRTPNRKADAHTVHLGHALGEAWDRTDAASKGKVLLLYTDFVDLDKILHGMEGGDFLILAARPGQGKTALATNIAYNVAKRGKNVVMFTLEMQNRQIAMRLIQMESGVSYGSQKDGKLTEEEWPLYTRAFELLGKLPIYLCDLPGIRIHEIKKTLRKLEAKYGAVDLVVIDYLQLVSPDDDNAKVREQEVSKVARGLKHIAKDFDIPVLACAQLSRALESRSEKRPQLSDLRESGELEQAADTVMFIYRPDQYGDASKQNIAEIVVAKNRNGPVGSVELIYRPSLTRFGSAAMPFMRLDEEKQ